MLKEHSINRKKNFIAAWYINDDQNCDDLINYFEEHPDTFTGKVGHMGIVQPSQKDSTDLFLVDFKHPVIKKYLQNLNKVLQEYKKLYMYCSEDQAPWSLNRTKSFNLQRYYPNQGYHEWHSETFDMATASRHLTYMTYLNDVSDKGETAFYYQDTKIKPEKGLTVIWGTDWTFTHRGIASPTETKYIATGHYHYD